MKNMLLLPARRSVLLALGATLLLGACSTAPRLRTTGDVTLTVKLAWVDGRNVEYLSTDTSDAGVATAEGINHVPRLADALNKQPGVKSLLERVYAFPGREQIPVFQSAPLPAGPTNTDRSYSPLWRMVVVKWQPKAVVRVLRSEEDILQAQDAGDVALTVTDVVINCPVLRTFEVKPDRSNS